MSRAHARTMRSAHLLGKNRPGAASDNLNSSRATRCYGDDRPKQETKVRTGWTDQRDREKLACDQRGSDDKLRRGMSPYPQNGVQTRPDYAYIEHQTKKDAHRADRRDDPVKRLGRLSVEFRTRPTLPPNTRANQVVLKMVKDKN